MIARLGITQALIFLGLGLVAYGCGQLVRHRGVRVNYTRKMNFFALFLVPALVNYLLPLEASVLTRTVRTLFFVLFLAIFFQPVRERLLIIKTLL